MKRTYERMLFMFIGAFIAFCAYLIGNIDSDINAKDIQDPEDLRVIQCDRLVVSESIMVGSLENFKRATLIKEGTIFVGDPGTGITLQSDSEGSSLTMKHPTNGNYVLLSNEDLIQSHLFWGDIKDSNNRILTGITQEGKVHIYASGKKNAVMELDYNNSNHIVIGVDNKEASILAKDNNGIKSLK